MKTVVPLMLVVLLAGCVSASRKPEQAVNLAEESGPKAYVWLAMKDMAILKVDDQKLTPDKTYVVVSPGRHDIQSQCAAAFVQRHRSNLPGRNVPTPSNMGWKNTKMSARVYNDVEQFSVDMKSGRVYFLRPKIHFYDDGPRTVFSDRTCKAEVFSRRCEDITDASCQIPER